VAPALVDPATNEVSAPFLVNGDDYQKTYPAVSTNAAGTQALVVWEQRPHNSPGNTNQDYYDVYGCYVDLSARTAGAAFPICKATQAQCSADVYGNRVVWADNRRSASIGAYDLYTGVVNPATHFVTESALDTSIYDCASPRIHGDLVAWIDGRNAYDVLAYRFSTGETIAVATTAAAQGYPAVGDKYIPYVDGSAGSGDIWGWKIDSQTTFHLETGPGMEVRSASAGDYVIWGQNPTLASDLLGARVTWWDGALTINGGAAWTKTTSVTLALAASSSDGAVQQARARESGADWGAWRPFASTMPWTLSGTDGLKTVEASFSDVAGWISHTCSAQITLDRGKPTVKAPRKATVKRGKKAKLFFKVTDALSPQVTVKIIVKNAKGKKVKTVSPGKKATGKLLSASFKCKLPEGKYQFFVYGTDLAGNKQVKPAKNVLLVK